jgi:hypothetical protein
MSGWIFLTGLNIMRYPKASEVVDLTNFGRLTPLDTAMAFALGLGALLDFLFGISTSCGVSFVPFTFRPQSGKRKGSTRIPNRLFCSVK